MPTFPKRNSKDSDDFESRFPTDPIQTGAIGYLIGFHAVLNDTSSRHVHESDPAAPLIKALATYLDKRRWKDVRSILKSLEDKDYFPIIELACAHAGMPGYADIIARRYAGIATRLVRALRTYPPSGDAQARIACEAAMRMRHAIIQSAAWSAVAAGHHRYRRSHPTIDHDTADQIACDLDASLSASILDSFERRRRTGIQRLRTLSDEEWQKDIDTTYGWMSWNKKGFYFECGMGWRHIIEDTLRRIDLSLIDRRIREEFSISQIKQKYGTLRIYFDGGDASTDAHVNIAEEVSKVTCELCGRMGSLKNRHGWLSVRCDECLEARQNT